MKYRISVHRIPEEPNQDVLLDAVYQSDFDAKGEGRSMKAPFKSHGGNPAIAHLGGKARASILKAEARRRASGDWGRWEQVGEEECRRMLGAKTGWVTEVRIAYRNSVFCVLRRKDSIGVIHVAVSSLSGIRPTWYEMQRIKDELFGEEVTAVEIYPPSNDIVDGSDMFHIWILPGDIPFGLTKIEASRGSAGPSAVLLLSGLRGINA